MLSKNKLSRYCRRGLGFIVFLFWVSQFILRATSFDGTPFLNHFSPPPGFEADFTSIARDNHGNLYFAGRQGVLVFDGLSWELLSEIRQPEVLYFDSVNQSLWVGGNKMIGYIPLQEGTPGEFSLVIHNDSLFDTFDRILPFRDSLLFCSASAIVSISSEMKPRIQAVAEREVFTGFIKHNDNLYVNIGGKGLHLYSEGHFLPVENGGRFSQDVILFSFATDTGYTLFATDNSFLYLFDGRNFSDFIPKDEEYLFNRILSHGIRLNDTTLALGTRNGGVLMLNTRTRETRFIINYQSGLPDNEVYSLFQADDHLLFIGHPYGFSQIDLTLPVKSFNLFPGLEGNILTLLPQKDRLVVGTSEGVFEQKQIRTYEKTRMMVRVPVHITDTIVNTEKLQSTTSEKKMQEVTQTGAPEKDEGKKGLLKKIFGKKSSGKPSGGSVSPEKTEKETTTRGSQIRTRTRTVYKYIPKDIYRFKSITYRFEKVKNLSARSIQLIPYGESILAATNAGLFEIKEGKAEYIFLGTRVWAIRKAAPGIILCGTDEGVYKLERAEGKWKTDRRWLETETPVYSLMFFSDTLWLGCESEVYRVITNSRIERPAGVARFSFPVTFPQPVTVYGGDNHPSFLMREGWYNFDPATKNMILNTGYPGENRDQFDFIVSGKELWIRLTDEWKNPDPGYTALLPYLNIFDGITQITAGFEGSLWITDQYKRIYKINPYPPGSATFTVRIKSFSMNQQAGSENFFFNMLRPSGTLKITLSAPWFIRPDKTQYQYIIEGFSNVWSDWKADPQIVIPYLPPGEYLIRYRAKNVLGITTEGKPMPFMVPAPFWQKWWFISTVLLFLVLLVYLIVRIRIQKLEKARQILEQKVRERTAEIQKQKEQIEYQRDEITHQKMAITDSINYAQRIQHAILPPDHIVEKLLPEHFILYQPRDIVSGDFYWIRKDHTRIIVAAADCTGHGVPGAFMSMLGISFLNEIYSRYPKISAPEILDHLRTMVKEALHQTGRTYEAKDGMDMSLIILETGKAVMEFAGAYNPVYVVRKGKLLEYKADKMPIGVHVRDEKPFTSQKIKLEDMDMIYLFSDGYADQFGGPEKKKFKLSRFMELLTSIADKDALLQKKILSENFYQWKSNLEQMDDVMVVGIRYRKNFR